jgi:hypothetical protein
VYTNALFGGAVGARRAAGPPLPEEISWGKPYFAPTVSTASRICRASHRQPMPNGSGFIGSGDQSQNSQGYSVAVRAADAELKNQTGEGIDLGVGHAGTVPKFAPQIPHLKRLPNWNAANTHRADRLKRATGRAMVPTPIAPATCPLHHLRGRGAA